MEEKVYTYKHPRPSVTVDCVVLTYEKDTVSVLLIERGNAPFKGYWAFPGGFLEMDETAEEGAKRELMEETGLQVDDLKQFHAFSAVDRDPRGRVISIAYYAITDSQLPVIGADDAAKAAWFSLRELPPLAFDHEEILYRALKAMRHELTVEAASLCLKLEDAWRANRQQPQN